MILHISRSNKLLYNFRQNKNNFPKYEKLKFQISDEIWVIGGSRPLVGLTRNRCGSHMWVVSAYLKISEMLLLSSLTRKTQKPRFWNSWIWVSERPSKHPNWSVCVLGVLRSRPPLRSRLNSEISIFHIRKIFYFAENYIIIYLVEKYAISWKCVFRRSKG